VLKSTNKSGCINDMQPVWGGKIMYKEYCGTFFSLKVTNGMVFVPTRTAEF